jgi:hypothetical protein
LILEGTVQYLLRLSAIIFCASVISGVASPQPVAAQVFTEPAKPATKKSRTRAPATSTRRKGEPREVERVAEAAPPPPTFSDPEAYCAANPYADGPTPELAATIPQWLTNGWKMASNNSQSTGAFSMKWKCSGGRVLACGSPIGQDMCAKPEPLAEATPEMETYCADKRKGAIPADITGNTTSVWVCKKRKPSLSGYRSDIDADGYLANTWVDISPFSPANLVGAVPRPYVASWQVPIPTDIFGSLRKSGIVSVRGRENDLITNLAVMQLWGGNIGEAIGTTVYYGQSAYGDTGATGCIADLILTEANMNAITVVERYRPAQRPCRGPEIFMLQEKDGQMLVNWMRKGKTKPKRSEWVQSYQ